MLGGHLGSHPKVDIGGAPHECEKVETIVNRSSYAGINHQGGSVLLGIEGSSEDLGG